MFDSPLSSVSSAQQSSCCQLQNDTMQSATPAASNGAQSGFATPGEQESKAIMAAIEELMSKLRALSGGGASEAGGSSSAGAGGVSAPAGATGTPAQSVALDPAQQSSTSAPTQQSAPADGGGQAAVDAAKEYMGTPYNSAWDRSYTGGGTDPNGLGLMGSDGSIDCSQLTSLAHGGTLPADCVTQGNMGERLDWQNAQAGDIIAFNEDGSMGAGNATHVGIADGQGNVIHASGYAGEVTVTPIADIPSIETWAIGM